MVLSWPVTRTTSRKAISMGVTQHRTKVWTEVMGADGEKIFAVGDKVRYKTTLTVPGAWSGVQNGTAVPAGALWVIQFIAALEYSRAMASIEFLASSSVGLLPLSFQTAIPQFVPATLQTSLVLFPGEFIQWIVGGALMNDLIDFTYLGYSMVIP